MDCRITDPKETKLLTGKLLDCLQSHLELILAKDVLARFDLDGYDIALMTWFKPRLQSLIQTLSFDLKPVNVIFRRHLVTRWY